MSRVKRDAGILVLVAILLGVFAWQAFPLGEKTNLGLDLQGGLSVILEAQTTADNPLDSNKMDQTVKIIQDRVNKLGVAEPEIQRQGENQISVQLPGITNQEQALQVIGKTASLEFFDVKDFGKAYTTEADALKAAGVASADLLPSGTEIIQWPSQTDTTTASDTWYVVTAKPAVTGAMLKGASVGYDQNNQPKVDMQFNDAGKVAFAAITKTLAERAQITGTDQLLAIVLDGKGGVGSAGVGGDPGRQRGDHRQVHHGRRSRTSFWCSTPVVFRTTCSPSARTASAPPSGIRRSTRRSWQAPSA